MPLCLSDASGFQTGRVVSASAFLAALLAAVPVSADPEDAAPARPDRDGAVPPEADIGFQEAFSGPTKPAAPQPTAPENALLKRLDEILKGAAEDLGMRGVTWVRAGSMPPIEASLVNAAAGGWAIAPQLVAENETLNLRLTAARAGHKTLLVRQEFVTEENLEVRAVSMLRDLSSHAASGPARIAPHVAPVGVSAPRSDGKAILAVTGAVTGAFVGFSVEHVGGSGDVTLIYPLMALGAGVGVGISVVLAAEWDIDVPKAWTLAAAVGWPTTAAILIADGTGEEQNSARYGYGLLGTGAGLALGSAALAFGDIDDGDAMLTHSGALFGMLYGGLAEMFINADTSISQSTGIGVGMGVGVIGAGAWAMRAAPFPKNRLLFADLGAILGGMAGAAAASPAIVGDEVSDLEGRIWIGSIALGTLTGTILGYSLTKENPGPSRAETPKVAPFAAQLDFGQTAAPRASAYGVRILW